MLRSNTFARKGRTAAALALATSSVLAALAHHAKANTESTWASETSGNWTTGTLWTSAPNDPNNGTPGGAVYDAFLNVTGGTPYTVTLNSAITVNSLTLGSADASLSQTGSTLTTSTVNVDAGSYTISGGTLSGAAIDISSPGQFLVSNGTLNGVSVSGGDLLANTLYVQNGITIADHNLDVGNYLYFDGPSQSVNNLNITPRTTYGYIYASGPTSGGPETLTLGSNVTVSGGFFIPNDHTGDALINNGTIDANNSTYSLNVQLSNFTNNATAEATGGGTLVISSANWTNNGTISATGTSSTVDLESSFTTAQMGTVTAGPSGTVNIIGALNNASATLTPSGGGTWYLDGGTITGGTINQSTQPLYIEGGTLNGVSVIGGDLLGTTLYVQNGITIADHNLDVGNYLYFDGPSQSVNNLNITPRTTYGYIYASGPTSGGPETLTLGSNVTVSGGFFIPNDHTGDALINNGTIDANNSTYTLNVQLSNFTNNATAEATGGGTLVISSANWTNNGTISATGTSSTVDLESSFTTAQMGTVTAGPSGTVNIIGALNNASATLTPSGGGTWYLDGGTITGGTINQSTQPLYIEGGTLNGVSVTGGDLLGTTLYVQNGITIADHNLDVGNYLYFDGPSQSVNNLNITPRTTYGYIYASGPTSGGPETLTLGSNVTVSGGFFIPNDHTGDALINNGTIDANNSTYSLNVQLSNFTNNATAEATNGGTLVLESPTWTNNATLSTASATTLDLEGTFTSGPLGSLTNNGTTSVTGNGTIGPITGTGNLTVDGSSNTLHLAANSSQSSQGSITISTGCTLDITNDSIIINFTGSDPRAAYQTLVNNGDHGGSWTGTTSITSSTVAAADAAAGSFKYGVAVADGDDGSGHTALGSHQLEITAALAGDANLDGKVDSTDLGIVLGDFGKTGQDWDEGSFNGSGIVDSTNLGLLLGNFGQTASLSVTQLDQIESLTGDSVVANADEVGYQLFPVPEPATLGLLMIATGGVLGRRRRRFTLSS